MRVGLVARADDRGIGTMTWEFHKNMHPDRTLIVREPGAEGLGFDVHPERYPGDTREVDFDPVRGQLDERTCRGFLAGLDVVYLVETAYDPRFYGWARDAKTATVLHAMPEFWRWHDDAEPRPDVWWLPTSWRRDVLPAECRLVPVPVPTPPARPVPPVDGHFVHVAGHRAAADRNGTGWVYRAARRARRLWTVRIESQGRLPAPGEPRVQLHTGGRPDRWEMYDHASVLVLPRAYGGLCLPVLEAMARGLAVAMTDAEPQRSDWPVATVRSVAGPPILTPAGRLATVQPNLPDLAACLDTLAVDATAVLQLQARSAAFADDNGWARLASVYRQELANAVEAAR